MSKQQVVEVQNKRMVVKRLTFAKEEEEVLGEMRQGTALPTGDAK